MLEDAQLSQVPGANWHSIFSSLAGCELAPMPPNMSLASVVEALGWNVDVTVVKHLVVIIEEWCLIKLVQLAIVVVLDFPGLHLLLHDVS